LTKICAEALKNKFEKRKKNREVNTVFMIEFFVVKKLYYSISKLSELNY